MFGAEYFFNDAGYDDADLYPWLAISGGFTPLYLGRHYGAFYTALIGPGDWNDTSFVLSTLGNLSDRSFITRLDVNMRVLTYLSWNIYAAGHYGSIGEFKYRFEIPPIPVVPELVDGLTIPEPLFDVGTAVSLSF